jgi:hypothetical protein
MTRDAVNDLVTLSSAFGNFANSTMSLFQARVDAEKMRVNAQLGASMTSFLERFNLPPGDPGSITTENWSDELMNYQNGVEQSFSGIKSEPIKAHVRAAFQGSMNEFHLAVSNKMGEKVFRETQDEYAVTLDTFARAGNTAGFASALQAARDKGIYDPIKTRAYDDVLLKLQANDEVNALVKENRVKIAGESGSSTPEAQLVDVGTDWDSILGKITSDINSGALDANGMIKAQSKLDMVQGKIKANDADLKSMYDERYKSMLESGGADFTTIKDYILSSDASSSAKADYVAKASTHYNGGVLSGITSFVNTNIVGYPDGFPPSLAKSLRSQVIASSARLLPGDNASQIKVAEQLKRIDLATMSAEGDGRVQLSAKKELEYKTLYQAGETLFPQTWNSIFNDIDIRDTDKKRIWDEMQRGEWGDEALRSMPVIDFARKYTIFESLSVAPFTKAGNILQSAAQKAAKEGIEKLGGGEQAMLWSATAAAQQSMQEEFKGGVSPTREQALARVMEILIQYGDVASYDNQNLNMAGRETRQGLTNIILGFTKAGDLGQTAGLARMDDFTKVQTSQRDFFKLALDPSNKDLKTETEKRYSEKFWTLKHVMFSAQQWMYDPASGVYLGIDVAENGKELIIREYKLNKDNNVLTAIFEPTKTEPAKTVNKPKDALKGFAEVPEGSAFSEATDPFAVQGF